MFNIGGSEMVVLGILALLVFGPEGLPGVIKTVMRTVHAFRQAANDFQHEVKTALDDENVRRDQLQRQRTPLPEELQADAEEADGNSTEEQAEPVTAEDTNEQAVEFPLPVPEATAPVSEETVPVPEESTPVSEETTPEFETAEILVAEQDPAPILEVEQPEEAALPDEQEESSSSVEPSPADDEDGPSLPMAARKRTE